MKLMSVINYMVALLVLMLGIKTVHNHTRDSGIICECKPTIIKISKDYLVCFEGCPITPVNSLLYNVTCSYMQDITITICKGERFVSTKPNIIVHEEYVWNTLVTKAWKIIITVLVWLTIVLMKIPSLCLFSVLNSIFNRIYEKKLKTCDVCSTKYSIGHVDCPTPGFKHRSDYNFIFYLLLIIIVVTTFAKADDNVYNYYRHGNSTEVQVLDKEHFEQDFDVNGYLYTISVTNSHLEVDVITVSEIQAPINHRLTHEHFSCDGEDGCKKECFDRTGRESMYSIKKAHDGISCFFTSATICGLCESDMKSIGYKVVTTKIRPYIDIHIKHGNKTEEIKIREFSQYIHEPYYVKPIEPFMLESSEYFVNGPNVYRGQMCNMPSYGCFGPNYIKDNKTYMIIAPKVSDPMTYDREIVLHHCVDPGNSDINSLEKTEFVYQNNTMIRPYEFGLISVGIPLSGKLIGDFCEKPVVVNDLIVKGCYDCQSGIEINVYYSKPERCGQIKCTVGRVIYEYFADTDSDHMTIHSFYDKEDVTITCNNHKKNVKLEHNKDTNYYKTNSDVHGSAAFDFNLIKHLPNLFYNFKAMAATILILIVTVYMIYNIAKQVAKHYFKVRLDKRIRHYKKTDVGLDPEVGLFGQTSELIVVTGSAQ
ncbi:glycoprotein precursor [Emaravirus toordali]|uniref:RNA2 n=1 Tax=Emaravirus toordali TaxID=1980430 RepID=A0A0G4DD82_9VIRU|nr:glycoprotein precursor [Emaravirus toordali]CCV01187.1 RNA2 [Emaravirus toordali]